MKIGLNRFKLLLYRLWIFCFGEGLDTYEIWYGRRRCECGSWRLVFLDLDHGWECLCCGETYLPLEELDIEPVEAMEIGG